MCPGRRAEPSGWPLLGVALSVAAFTSPSGGVLAAIVCLALLLGRDSGLAWRSVMVCAVVNLPWIVPSLLYGGGIPSDRAGVSAFAGRADTPYGILGSLASLGGIWNADVVPPGRDSWVLSGCLLVLCVGGLVGIRWVGRVAPGLPPLRLLGLAVVGIGLAALPALRFGLPLMEWVDSSLPGGGLLRDSQKWVALLALVEAIGLAALVDLLRHRWRRYGAAATWWLLAGAVLAPVAVTVSLAWGLSGRLEPEAYPGDWPVVAGLLDQAQSQEGHGDVAVLPWSIYRQYGWNDDRPLLDPAPRFFTGDVVIADTLVVGDRAISGEGDRATRIGALFGRGGDVSQGLRRLGIGLVVVERGTPGVGEYATLTGDQIYDGGWLELWALGTAGPGPPGPSTLARGLWSLVTWSRVGLSSTGSGCSWVPGSVGILAGSSQPSGRPRVVATLLSAIAGAVVAGIFAVAGVAAVAPDVKPAVSQGEMVKYGRQRQADHRVGGCFWTWSPIPGRCGGKPSGTTRSRQSDGLSGSP